jgi:phosphinothricin acetyltransferase
MESFQSVVEQGLPYVVAVEAGGDSDAIQGYAYASGYRQPSHMGYAPTVELTVFAHPSSRSKGVGTIMMDTLLAVLREPSSFPNYIDPSRVREVREVLAVMAVDTDGPGGGYGLKEWYGRWGFVQVGELKRVGNKFGRWIDTLLLQLSLVPQNEK